MMPFARTSGWGTRAGSGCVLLVALAGCGAAQARPALLLQLDRDEATPLAHQVQHDAPAAYAEFARSVHDAESSANAGADALRERVGDAELTLAWAATQARSEAARTRVREADRRRADFDGDTARMEHEAQALEHEADERQQAQLALVHAREASAAPSSVAVPDRAARAAEVLQEAELADAAAGLLGAEAGAKQRVETLIQTADQAARHGDPTAALVSAGRAFVAAETLLRDTREQRPSASSAPPMESAGLVNELSQTSGLDAHQDARGVVAVMHGLFAAGTTYSTTARGRLETMAHVIQGHRDSRVRIEAYVGGADRARAERAALARAQAVVAALVHAGVPQERMEPAGLYRLPGGARSDDTVEVVLVMPNQP